MKQSFAVENLRPNQRHYDPLKCRGRRRPYPRQVRQQLSLLGAGGLEKRSDLELERAYLQYRSDKKELAWDRIDCATDIKSLWPLPEFLREWLKSRSQP